MKKTICIILILLLAAVLFYLHTAYGWTAQEILAWKPPNLIVAAVIILAAYAVKSVLVFVPIMIMQIAAGHFFSREVAIFINTLGLAIVMTVPYWIGKIGGAARMEKIMLNIAWVGLSALGCWLFRRFTPSNRKEEEK